MTGRIVVALLALAALALLWPSATPVAAGGGCRGMPVTEGSTTTVQLSEMPCFSPEMVHIRPGDTVTWANEGLVAHTVTGENASWGDFSELSRGDSVAHRFDAAGVYPYYCLLHPGMVGAIVVADNAGSTPGESASLAGLGVDGAVVSGSAALNADGNGNSVAMIGLYAGIALAAAAATGAAGFALGRRR
jgi:plastocyanin